MKKVILIILSVNLGLFLIGLAYFKWIYTEPVAKVNIIEKSWEDYQTDPETMYFGQVHYNLRCKKCHGLNGAGTGKGPSLVDNQWVYGEGIDAIYQIIKEGSPSGLMYGWKNKLRDEDLRAIAVYVSQLK